MAEGRPSSLQEDYQGVQRRRRSPNLGIATLALDALGKAFGVGALGSNMSPAEAALAVFVTRKIIVLHPSTKFRLFMCCLNIPRLVLQTTERIRKPGWAKSFLRWWQAFFTFERITTPMIARTINLLCCDYSVFYLMIYSNDKYILTPTRVPYSIVCYINIDLILFLVKVV